MVLLIIFSEKRKTSVLSVGRRIKGTCLYILCIVIFFILHIIGKGDKLNQIEEFPVIRIFQSPVYHPIEFFLNAAVIIGLFYFQKGKRHSIDQNIDIRSKRSFLCSFHDAVGQFVYDCKIILCNILKINQLHSVLRRNQPVVKLFSQIIVFQHIVNIGQNTLHLIISKISSIDSFQSRLQPVHKNLCIKVNINIIRFH